ncbi:hypothetical protein BASA81_002786 [Batrachochytrium salamandrivorans]|nr:hypothetical protein BASA81_002786 [Batrachochytrium salamandrivorans]
MASPLVASAAGGVVPMPSGAGAVGGAQEVVLNKVGLSFHPANGSLALDLGTFAIDFQDTKGNRTRICQPKPGPARSPLVSATWSELGKEASLQLYFQGHEEEDNDSEDENNGLESDDDNDDRDGGDGEDAKEKRKQRIRKAKHNPKFLRLHGLSGLDRDTFDKLFSTGYGLELKDESWDVRGANYGELTLSKLKRCIVIKDFDTESIPAIEIPLANASQIAAPGKNEVEIQYTPSTTLGAKAFELSTVRFYIPSEPTQPDEEDKNAEAEEWRSRFKTVSDMYDEQDEETLGLVCHIGEEICDFVSPKGRYNLDLYRDFFRMRGKTYDFKIPYSHLVNIHLLDHPEQDAKFLMMTLNQAIRHGHQNVSHLVMVVEDEDTELELAMTSEELKEKYPEANLLPIMKGPMPESVAKLLKGVSNKKVLIMPLTGFTAESNGLGARKERCVKCNVKTNAGFLFPMKTALVFLHKPVLSIKYERIEAIEFKRNASTMSSDSFDLEVSYGEDGDKTKKVVEFTLIPRKQFDALRKFFVEQSTVKIKRKDELATFFSAAAKAAASVASLNGVSAAAVAKAQNTTINDLGSDDESEDEDSDFDAGPNRRAGSDDDDDDASSSNSDSDDSELDDEVPMGTLEEELGDAAMLDQPEEDVVVSKRVRKPSGLDLTSKPKKKVKVEEEVKKPAAATLVSKKKDKNAPKSAKTAYTYFIESKKEEFAKFTFAERSQKASELWKLVTDKSEFEAKAAEDKKRYAEEMKTYVPPPAGDEDDGEAEGEEDKSKKKKDKNAPKAARTAYTFFSDEFRASLKDQNLTFGDMNRKLGEMWKAQEDKTKWNSLSIADKERYKTEMKTYVPPPAEPISNKKTTKKSASDTAAVGSKKKKPAAAAAAAAVGKKPMLTSALPSGSSSSEDDASDVEVPSSTQ